MTGSASFAEAGDAETGDPERGGGPSAQRRSSGEVGDFESIALPFLDDVYRFALYLARQPDDADDLVQETYLKAYRSWRSFTVGTDCRSWLFTICKNTFRRRYRREQARPDVEGEAVGDEDALPIVMTHVQAERLGLGDLFDRLDVQPVLREAVGALPDIFREVVVLVDLEGLSYEEAAEVLEIPRGTVRSRLFLARRRLQEALIDQAVDMGLATAAEAPEGESP